MYHANSPVANANIPYQSSLYLMRSLTRSPLYDFPFLPYNTVGIGNFLSGKNQLGSPSPRDAITSGGYCPRVRVACQPRGFTSLYPAGVWLAVRPKIMLQIHSTAHSQVIGFVLITPGFRAWVLEIPCKHKPTVEVFAG